jgi:DNA-binding response OmpR family regulator
VAVATILVADSSDDRRAGIGEAVAAAGHTPVFATTGDAALAAVKADAPDLVVADAELTGVDGIRLTGLLRKQFPTVPVLLVIDIVSKEAVAAGLRAGAAAYLPRQSVARELPSVVRELLTVAASQRRRVMFLLRLAAVEYRFDLESDPDLVPNLVSQAELLLAQMELFDEADRMRVGVAVHEAAVNAIVHGNLEVSSDLKADGWEVYHRAIAARRQQLPYSARRVTVVMRAERRREFSVRIADQGSGFDVTALPDPTDPENILKGCGRGMLMIRSFFDAVEHNPKGNEITMSKRASSG